MGCRTYTAEIEGEEVQKTFLRECRTYITEIEGEETQKSFIRGCRACVFQCGRVGVCLRYPQHFASYHHIISHNITSYIVLHQWHKNRIRSQSSANASSKWKCAKARSKLWEIQPCHKKGYLSLRSMDFFLYEAWISFFTKHEKEGKMFFRRRLKNSMYVSFMHRKEINCNNLHIQFNITHFKYYIALLQ
jgi:hypothetical protein